MVEMGIPLGQWSGSAAANALRESIERFNARTARQTAWRVGLTWVMLWSAKADAQGLTTEPYSPSWGFETCTECLQAASNVNEKFGKGEGNYGAQCLLDTVDPRVPKGK